jgi:hypothetical protein
MMAESVGAMSLKMELSRVSLCLPPISRHLLLEGFHAINVRIGIGQPCAMERNDVAEDHDAVSSENVLAKIHAQHNW